MLEYLLDFSGSGVNAYLVIIVVLVLTGSGLPIPEEIPVIVAGILSADGEMNVWLAFAACLAGALGGDCLMYGIGRRFGRSVLGEHPWFARFIRPDREARIEQMLQRHGLKAFFLARFLVGLRSPMFLAAGILRVPFRRFIVVDAFCATIVIGFFFFLSYTFAEQIHGWWRWIRGAEMAFTVTLVAAAAVVIYMYWRRRRRKADVTPVDAADEPGEPAESTKFVA